MTMYEHFEDVNYRIKEMGCVAELIAIEAMKLTQRVTGKEKTIDAELLRVLTALVVHNLYYDEIKIEYKQRQRQRGVNREIDAAIAAQRK